MSKCPKCAGTDVVWVNDLKTYKGTSPGVLSLYAGTLRSEGVFKAKVCRGCGYSELYLKDLAFLKEPSHPFPEGYVTPTEEELPKKKLAKKGKALVAESSPGEGAAEAPATGGPSSDQDSG